MKKQYGEIFINFSGHQVINVLNCYFSRYLIQEDASATDWANSSSLKFFMKAMAPFSLPGYDDSELVSLFTAPPANTIDLPKQSIPGEIHQAIITRYSDIMHQFECALVQLMNGSIDTSEQEKVTPNLEDEATLYSF